MILKESRERYQFLEAWARQLNKVVAYVFKTGVSLGIEPINAPRVAGLRVAVGKNADEIRAALEKQDMAMLRQSVPFKACPDAVLPDASPITTWWHGRYVIYLPWSDQLAEKDILTSDLLDGAKGLDDSEWIVGLGEEYKPVVCSLDPKRGSPHWFAIGSTTSGKSTAIKNMIAQLGLNGEKTRFGFIDVAKKGDGLGEIPRMASALGPPAWEIEDARNLLGWFLDEMDRRYRNPGKGRERLVLVIDEFPALRDDQFCVNAVDAITSRGATANVHVVLVAQHAIKESIGPFAGIVKANVGGRLVFKCGTDQNSIQAMGDDRGMKLVPPGDCYVLHGNMPEPIRVQASYFTDEWIAENPKFGEPMMSEWPEVSADSGPGKSRARDFTGMEIGLGLMAAKMNHGRGTLEKLLKSEGVKMGSTVSRDLSRVGKDLYAWLRSQGLDIVFVKGKGGEK